MLAFHRTSLALALLSLVAAGSLVTANTGAADTGTGVRPSSPSPGTASTLAGVSADSPTDVWAVGIFFLGRAQRSLLLHSDGTGWTKVANPRPPGEHRLALTAVSAEAPDDVWVVGSYQAAGHSQTLADHWDGSSWTQIPSPNPGGSGNDNMLTAVSADSPTDAWAVGWYQGSVAARAIALHWNGASWTRVATPDPGGSNGTFAVSVAVTSADDGWLSGSYWTTEGAHSLIEHWDGSAWTLSPTPGRTSRLFSGVSAVSATDAWAVGYSSNRADRHATTLIEHWDGSTWHLVASRSPEKNSFLLAVSSPAEDDAWAVGTALNVTGESTLIEHWNGSVWTKTSAPAPRGSQLNGVTATSPTDATSVGQFDHGAAHQDLAVHWDGVAWTRS